jgi:beta-ribofuranosylaminobenzene 5'-phosphate synthase
MNFKVRAYSRLHFGLMEICPGHPHCYGGVGMMIDSPCMIVQGRLSHAKNDRIQDRGNSEARIEVSGDTYWTERTQRAVSSWLAHASTPKLPLESFCVVLPPQPHVGLGSGTQWACSVVGLLQLAHSIDHLPLDEESIWRNLFPDAGSLAVLAGRGLRSHIGTEGFRCGGWIVDWGQSEQDRTQTLSFPEHWRIVTLCDSAYEGESGPAEAKIFERCSHQPNSHRPEMVRLIQQEMIPSILDADWPTASQAIGRYGALAGQIFEPLQGGVYRSPSIAACVAAMQELGIHGVGQSSWGPTVFALAQDEEQANWIAERMRTRSSGNGKIQISNVAPPATYEVESSS